ncbi:hypothetical protein D3C78_19190 [compost metagenome]
MNLSDQFVSNLDKENGVLAWRVLGLLNVENANKAADLIRSSIVELKAKGPVKLLVDNRLVKAFPPQVNEIWDTLQREILPQVDKCAIICSGMVMRMQMNRVAQATGFSGVTQSFWDEDPSKAIADACEFIGVKSNALVK